METIIKFMALTEKMEREMMEPLLLVTSHLGLVEYSVLALLGSQSCSLFRLVKEVPNIHIFVCVFMCVHVCMYVCVLMPLML